MPAVALSSKSPERDPPSRSQRGLAPPLLAYRVAVASLIGSRGRPTPSCTHAMRTLPVAPRARVLHPTRSPLLVRCSGGVTTSSARATTDPTRSRPRPPRRAVLGSVAATIAGSLDLVADLRALALEAEVKAEAVAEAVAPAEGAILITGANSGVGFSTAKQLAAQGKRVVLACHTEKKAPQPRA